MKEQETTGDDLIQQGLDEVKQEQRAHFENLMCDEISELASLLTSVFKLLAFEEDKLLAFSYGFLLDVLKDHGREDHWLFGDDGVQILEDFGYNSEKDNLWEGRMHLHLYKTILDYMMPDMDRICIMDVGD